MFFPTPCCNKQHMGPKTSPTKKKWPSVKSLWDIYLLVNLHGNGKMVHFEDVFPCWKPGDFPASHFKCRPFNLPPSLAAWTMFLPLPQDLAAQEWDIPQANLVEPKKWNTSEDTMKKKRIPKQILKVSRLSALRKSANYIGSAKQAKIDSGSRTGSSIQICQRNVPFWGSVHVETSWGSTRHVSSFVPSPASDSDPKYPNRCFVSTAKGGEMEGRFKKRHQWHRNNIDAFKIHLKKQLVDGIQQFHPISIIELSCLELLIPDDAIRRRLYLPMRRRLWSKSADATDSAKTFDKRDFSS